MKRLAVAAIVGAAVVAGCGPGDDASREDAHDVPGREIDKTKPHIVAFNNKYQNVASKCDGYGHRIFVTTASRLLVLPDPSCSGYRKNTALGIAASPVGQGH